MKKRILALAMVLTMLLQLITVSADSGIVIGNLKFENGKIIVPVTVDKAGEGYSLLVIRKGGNPENIDDRYAMDEKISGDDLNIEFKFRIPETKKCLVSDGNPDGFTDGTYTITVKGNHTDKASLDFDYVTESGKNQAMDKIMGAQNADEIETVLSPDSQQRIAYVNSGFDFSKYDESGLQSEISKIVFDNLPESNEALSEVFNTAVVMALINDDAENAKKYLEGSNFVFEGTKFDSADAEVKEWIGKVFAENIPFTSKAVFDDTYAVANALYKVMNAKFDTLEDVLGDYAEVLGIKEAKEYKDFKELNSADTKATGETFVKKVNSSPVYSAEALLSLLKKSFTEADDKDNDNKYTGGGSSSGRGGFSGGITITKSEEIDEVIADDVIPAAGKNDGFYDLDSVEWAKDAIKYLYDRKMISGVGDGEFDPNGVVTREAFAKMAVNAVGAYDASVTSEFSDVVPGSWYESYVASGVEKGLIKGTGNGLFGVGSSITRQDVAVIIARCADLMGVRLEEAGNGLFADDSEISDYAKESVYALTASGIINGVGENKFDPKGNCTRAQAARLIYMLLTYVEDETGISTDNTASTSRYIPKFRFLKGLGMFRGVSDDLFDENAVIIKKKFIENAMRLVCGEEVPDSELLAKAKNYGVGVSPEYDFEGKMSFNEAVAIVTRLSGIEGIDSEAALGLTDTYKGYITQNTNGNGSETIKQGDVVNILYNAAHYEGTVEVNGQMEYALSDETILESKRDIRRVKGIVTDNGAASLSGDSAIAADEVRIDGVTALQGISNAGDFLGKYVTAYIYFGKDENKVIYVESNDRYTTELIISSDDLENVNTSSRKIEYLEGNKLKTVDYSPVVKVIKNGKYFADYEKKDLLIKNGSLRLVDNDNDRKYDVIFIENFSYIVVEGVIPAKNIIRNAYKQPASFDFYKVEKYSIIYNGSEISLSDVKYRDVLSIVSTGTDVDDNVTIYVTRDKITGKVTGRDAAEETVSIDGVAYKYSDAYTDAAEYKDEEGNIDSAVTTLQMGKTYDVYLDRFGRIAYAEESKKASDYEYVYATKIYEVEEGEGVFMLKYFTMNSEWKHTEFADKVNYNNAGALKKDDFANRAYKDGFKADIYRVRYNEDGKISSFEFATETDDSDVFNKKTVTGLWSVNGYGIHTDTNSDRFYLLLDTDTRMVLVPESGNDDEFAIGNRTLLRSDQRLTLTGYGIDEFGAADVTIYVKETNVSESSTPVVVDRVEETYIDGEARQILYGVNGTDTNYSVVAAKNGLFDGLSSGDLIALTTGALDRAENIMVLFSPKNQYGLQMGASVISNNTFVPGKFSTSIGFIAGFVEDINYEENKVKLNTGEAEPHIIRTYHHSTTPVFFIYDMTEETLTAGKADDIVKGDYVFMRTSWTKLLTAYIVRK